MGETLWLLLGGEHSQEGQELERCTGEYEGCDRHQKTRPTLSTCLLERFFVTKVKKWVLKKKKKKWVLGSSLVA